ncbi:hypothetical protein MBANPS3_002147 [Mucor bainieri]
MKRRRNEAGSTWSSTLVSLNDFDELERGIDSLSPVAGSKSICGMVKILFRTMVKAFRKRSSLSHSEVVYNSNVIFPCMEAMMRMMKDNCHAPYFVPGEEELVAMTKVVSESAGKKLDKSKIYKADGNLDDFEVLILETAGPFSAEDNEKISFDNSKGMFALLAMLKTIADKYKYASVEDFKKVKLYLLQPSGVSQDPVALTLP